MLQCSTRERSDRAEHKDREFLRFLAVISPLHKYDSISSVLSLPVRGDGTYCFTRAMVFADTRSGIAADFHEVQVDGTMLAGFVFGVNCAFRHRFILGEGCTSADEKRHDGEFEEHCLVMLSLYKGSDTRESEGSEGKIESKEK